MLERTYANVRASRIPEPKCAVTNQNQEMQMQLDDLPDKVMRNIPEACEYQQVELRRLKHVDHEGFMTKFGCSSLLAQQIHQDLHSCELEDTSHPATPLQKTPHED